MHNQMCEQRAYIERNDTRLNIQLYRSFATLVLSYHFLHAVDDIFHKRTQRKEQRNNKYQIHHQMHILKMYL